LAILQTKSHFCGGFQPTSDFGGTYCILPDRNSSIIRTLKERKSKGGRKVKMSWIWKGRAEDRDGKVRVEGTREENGKELKVQYYYYIVQFAVFT